MSVYTMLISFELKGSSLNWYQACTGFKANNEKYWKNISFSPPPTPMPHCLYLTDDKFLVKRLMHKIQAKLPVILNLPLLQGLHIKIHSNSLYKYSLDKLMYITVTLFKEHCNKSFEGVFFHRVGLCGFHPPSLTECLFTYRNLCWWILYSKVKNWRTKWRETTWPSE